MFFMITLPITGQNLINFSVNMADTIMVGQLGEIQLSAVQQANQVAFLMFFAIFGLTSGANVMIAQYWGKGDTQSIHKVMSVTYRILAIIIIIFTMLAVGFPVQVMRLLGVGEIVAEGAAYLRIAGIGYLFMGFAASSLIMLRAVATVKIALVVASTTLFVNVGGNWILIFGNLGAPALGVQGAAIATTFARFIEFIIVAVYVLKVEKKLQYRLRYLLARKLNFLKEFLKTATPVFLNEVLWGLGAVMLSVIIGHMGTEFTAANSVAGVLNNLVSVAIFGAISASAVITGNTVGSGRYDLARARSKKLLIISTLMGLVAMVVVLIFRYPVILLFGNISLTAQAYAFQILGAVSIIVIFQALSGIAIVGVLRGGGDGKFAAVADVTTMWLVALPLGFLAGHVWGLPVPVVYMILKMDELLKAIVCLPRMFSGKWVNDVTV